MSISKYLQLSVSPAHFLMWLRKFEFLIMEVLEIELHQCVGIMIMEV